MNAPKIHRQIHEVDEENIRNVEMVKKWDGTFKNGRTNVHDDESLIQFLCAKLTIEVNDKSSL